MRKIILSLASLVAVFSLNGQTTQTANQVLSRAEQAIYTYASSEANFTSSYLDSRGKVQSKVSGMMYLEGEKFRLVYGDIIAVYSNKTLTHYDDDEETLTISEPTGEELLQINPLHFLRARAKGFNVKEQGNKGGFTSLAFTPLGKSGMKQVTISFVDKSGLPSLVSIMANDGSKVIITINAFRSVKEHPKGFFELNAKQYPKCEVVDLR